MSAHWGCCCWQTWTGSRWWPGPRPWAAPTRSWSCRPGWSPGCPRGCPAHWSRPRCSASRNCRPGDLRTLHWRNWQWSKVVWYICDGTCNDSECKDIVFWSLPRASLGLNWKLSLFHRGSLAGSSQYFARLKQRNQIFARIKKWNQIIFWVGKSDVMIEYKVFEIFLHTKYLNCSLM